MPPFSPEPSTVREQEPTNGLRDGWGSQRLRKGSVDRQTSVSVVIPTYNESGNVRTVVDRCRSVLRNYPFEIIVVDDDSPDETWRVVRETYRDDKAVSVVRRTEDRGLATAVARGFREASFDVCVVLDADLQHPPGKVPDLVEAFDEGTDIVIGSRYTEGGAVENWSFARRLVSRGATRIARGGLPDARGIDDPLSGFFAVRRRLVRDDVFYPLGYKILLELLVKCDHDRVVEVPYTFSEREHGDSNLTPGEYLNFLRHVGRLRRAGADGVLG